MTRVLGIDPGISTCAYVVMEDRIPITFGGFFMLNAKTDDFDRVNRIVRALQKIAIAYKVDAVGAETYFGKGKLAEQRSAANYKRGMVDCLMLYALSFIPIYRIHPVHLKQWVTGNHVAGKDLMVDSCRATALKACPSFLDHLDASHSIREREHILEAWALGTIAHCLHNRQYTGLNYPADKKAILKNIDRKKPLFKPRYKEPPVLPRTIIDDFMDYSYDKNETEGD